MSNVGDNYRSSLIEHWLDQNSLVWNLKPVAFNDVDYRNTKKWQRREDRRDLNRNHVEKIANGIINGAPVPAPVVAVLPDGTIGCIDGLHRFSAWGSLLLPEELANLQVWCYVVEIGFDLAEKLLSEANTQNAEAVSEEWRIAKAVDGLKRGWYTTQADAARAHAVSASKVGAVIKLQDVELRLGTMGFIGKLEVPQKKRLSRFQDDPVLFKVAGLASKRSLKTTVIDEIADEVKAGHSTAERLQIVDDWAAKNAKTKAPGKRTPRSSLWSKLSLSIAHAENAKEFAVVSMGQSLSAKERGERAEALRHAGRRLEFLADALEGK